MVSGRLLFIGVTESKCEDEYVLAGGNSELCIFCRVDFAFSVDLYQTDGASVCTEAAAFRAMGYSARAYGRLEQ